MSDKKNLNDRQGRDDPLWADEKHKKDAANCLLFVSLLGAVLLVFSILKGCS